MRTVCPTRHEALKKFDLVIAKLGRAYAENRNYDLGPNRHTNVSTLSPWVRHRIVLEEELVAGVLNIHGARGAEKFVQEVFWRTYWKG